MSGASCLSIWEILQILSFSFGDVDDTELEYVSPEQEDVEEVIGELKDQIEKEKLPRKEITEAEQVLQLQAQLDSLKLSTKQSEKILQQRIDGARRGESPAVAGAGVQSTETSAGPGKSTSVTWSQNSPILQHGGISGMAYPWGNTTFPSGVAQFPSQMWSKQGAAAASLPIPGLPGHLQLPPLAPGTAPVAAAATGFDQLIGAAGTSHLGAAMPAGVQGASGHGLYQTGAVSLVPQTLLPQSLLHRSQRISGPRTGFVQISICLMTRSTMMLLTRN